MRQLSGRIASIPVTDKPLARTALSPSEPLDLHAGDWVEVKSAAEILATLDERGTLDHMPFMPEMLKYSGKRFQVYKTAHKTCDTITQTGGRRLTNTVHLAGLRCSGEAHGGCEAACLIFWKEAWLRPVVVPMEPNPAPGDNASCSIQGLHRATQAPDSQTDDPSYRCQTTELLAATKPLPWWHVQQYLKDVTSGNHKVRDMARLFLLAGFRQLLEVGVGYRFLVAAYNFVQKLRGGMPYPHHRDAIVKGGKTPTEILDLKVGELVQVKSHDEIRATTSAGGFNRGMRFDEEMAKYCGKTYRVSARVTKILHEKTGKMIEMKNPCILLDDVFCRAECTSNRLGCPRALSTYWREIWLRRVEQPVLEAKGDRSMEKPEKRATLV